MEPYLAWFAAVWTLVQEGRDLYRKWRQRREPIWKGVIK